MRALWQRVSIGWCRTFHSEPFWPIHGHYYCPSCLRTYPVPWQEGKDFARRVTSAAGAREHHPGFVTFEFQKNRG